jgi:hypothetical protein
MMAFLTVSAQALKRPGGVLLAVEVRDGSGFEVQQLDQGAFKVWSVQGLGDLNSVTISEFREVATSLSPQTGSTGSTQPIHIPGIQELTGLYLLFLSTPADIDDSLFSVHVTGHLNKGAWIPPHAFCLATVANLSMK